MATANAPTTHEELIALLKDDNKVKVAGVDGQSCTTYPAKCDVELTSSERAADLT